MLDPTGPKSKAIVHNVSMDAVQLHNAAKGVARPGERILWIGEPRHGLFLRRSDVVVVPLTLVWTAFAVFWTISATSAGAPLFFTLWGCMFVAFGCYFVFGRFIADAWQPTRRPLEIEMPVGWPGASRYQRPMLDSIPDARDVYDTLLAAAQTAGVPRAG